MGTIERRSPLLTGLIAIYRLSYTDPYLIVWTVLQTGKVLQRRLHGFDINLRTQLKARLPSVLESCDADKAIEEGQEEAETARKKAGGAVGSVPMEKGTGGQLRPRRS